MCGLRCRKARRRPHNGTLIRATYPGEIWHTDIMEAGLTAVDGTKYAVTFTDEASKQIITICLKKKSEFGGVMTEFLARLHTLPELMVLDTGGENVSKQFLQVCYRFCIQPRYTTPEKHEE